MERRVLSWDIEQCCQSVGAKREREAGAWERIFQKMVGSEASPERLYIYIYIFKKKHVECQTRCKIYETCMFVILPIYEMPSKFHIIHHSMNLT
jgi:hypothetical protein